MNNYFHPVTINKYPELVRCFSRMLVRVAGPGSLSDYSVTLRNVQITKDRLSLLLVVTHSDRGTVCAKDLTIPGGGIFIVNTPELSATVSYAGSKNLTATELIVLPSCVVVIPTATEQLEDIVLTANRPFQAVLEADVVRISASMPEPQMVITELPDAILSINGIYPEDGSISVSGYGQTVLDFGIFKE